MMGSINIIVMGVSGSGKSTVGLALAKALQCKFIDGDDLHPKSNIIKMASGEPLNDDDRAPWLERINDVVFSIHQKRESCVVVCSALKRKYRERIRVGNGPVYFLFLDGTIELISERVQKRSGHFMKLDLLQSQFDALEVPENESNIIRLDVGLSVDEIVQQTINELKHEQ